MNLGSLYQEVILDHAKHPHNYGALDGRTHEAKRLNPTCGDTVSVQIILGDEDTITQIKFQGAGCAISQASASMMTDLMLGKTLPEAHRTLREFQAKMVDTDQAFTFEAEEMEEVEALGGVRKFPNRIRCATLAWHALEDALGETD